MKQQKKSFMGEYGIRGRTGLTGNKEGIFHISANYDSNGKVFVYDGDYGWRRTTLKQAKKRKLSIIQCARCKSPAISLDHHYPYMSDMSRCKKHMETKP